MIALRRSIICEESRSGSDSWTGALAGRFRSVPFSPGMPKLPPPQGAPLLNRTHALEKELKARKRIYSSKGTGPKKTFLLL